MQEVKMSAWYLIHITSWLLTDMRTLMDFGVILLFCGSAFSQNVYIELRALYPAWQRSKNARIVYTCTSLALRNKGVGLSVGNWAKRRL